VGKGLIKFFGNFNRSSFSLYNHDILDYALKQPFDLVNDYRYGNLSYQTALNSTWDLRSGLSYTLNNNNVQQDNVPMSESEKGIHAKSVLEHSISDRVEVRFGGEVIDRNYEASRIDEVTNQTQTQSFRESIGASFAEVEMYANKHLVAKIGGRYEYNSLSLQSTVDPRISVAYKPSKKGQFSFAYGTFRQSPKNQYLRMDNQLVSERAQHYIANYQIINDRKTLRIEGYYKIYSDLVKFTNGNPFLLTNTGKGYAKGIELFWRDSQTIKNVDYWISYSYLDTKRDYLNYPAAAVPTFASSHNFSVVYKHFVKAIKSQLGFTYSYSSGRSYYNPNLSTEKFQSERTPSYQDLSANVSYLPRNWLILYVSCTNLLGRDNIFGYEYSTQANASGEYVSREVRQPASRFMFLGVFITISKNKSINQLPNL
jgi:hypothetical protein